MVTTEQVRLTPDMQSRQGAVWSRIVSITLYISASCAGLQPAIVFFIRDSHGDIVNSDIVSKLMKSFEKT